MSGILSVVVPVYQNQANLNDTIPRLLELRDRIGELALELVFVDDGSSDGSLDILKRFAADHAGVIRIVKLSRNFGQTPAVQAGLRFARGDCVGIISADLQEPLEALLDMLEAWRGGAKFAIGERREREEGLAHRRISSIYWTLVRKFAFPRFPELGYDFCLLDRQVVEDLNRINEKNSSIFVLIFWLGYEPVRIPIVRRRRERGRSQWRLATKIRFTVDTLIGFTYLPARIITFMGLATASLAMTYLGVVFVKFLLYRTAPPGYMTVIGLITLLGAALLFSIGILSEYLLRILDEARKRPPYIVETVIEAHEGEERLVAAAPERANLADALERF